MTKVLLLIIGGETRVEFKYAQDDVEFEQKICGSFSSIEEKDSTAPEMAFSMAFLNKIAAWFRIRSVTSTMTNYLLVPPK